MTDLDVWEVGSMNRRTGGGTTGKPELDEHSSIIFRSVRQSLHSLRDVSYVLGGLARTNAYSIGGFGNFTQVFGLIARVGSELKGAVDQKVNEFYNDSRISKTQLVQSLKKMEVKFIKRFNEERKSIGKFLAKDDRRQDHGQDFEQLNNMWWSLAMQCGMCLGKTKESITRGFFQEITSENLTDVSAGVSVQCYGKGGMVRINRHNLERLLEIVFGVRCDGLLAYDFSLEQFRKKNGCDEIRLITAKRDAMGLSLCYSS